MSRKLIRAIPVSGVPILLAALLVGCAKQHPAVTAVGSPEDLFDKVRSVRAGTHSVVEPASLEDALPGRELSEAPATGVAESKWSDVVVQGRITEVRPGDAIRYTDVSPNAGEEFRVVDFADPSAHERNVVVTIAADWAAGEAIGSAVDFRLGVLGGGDPYHFMASLRGLQQSEVVVVLARREDGRHAGEYYPIMSGALIGRVQDNGVLHFPGLGPQEDRFLGEVDTAAELRRQATAAATDF